MAPSTRRRFLQAAGASAAGAALGYGSVSPARAAGRPNVVVLVIDTPRADHVGAYGGRALTPNVDALAREGLRFTRAVRIGGQDGRDRSPSGVSERELLRWLPPELRDPRRRRRLR